MAAPELWICPKCGARLVSRNLGHSCGKFSLEDLFAKSTPSALELARSYVDMLGSLGDVQVLPQKTRLVGCARVRFTAIYPQKEGFLAGFALHRWIESPRVRRTESYGPRWCYHYVKVTRPEDLDAELRAWLQESHDVVGLQSDLRAHKA